jgi:Sugar phosphate permease
MKPARVLFASLIGTTIEFFDFYIYGTAAVIVFPTLFFPASDPTTATLQSLATFALAFLARPAGSALFGHFGDRIGRKATLVAALLTMGLSTVAIGLLPTYAQIGVLAPALLALCRFGQGIGLGGEWGGAVLLAMENAPRNKRAWYGMYPQLGAPLGFILATGVFIILSRVLTDEQFFAWGWRIPFLSSALMVVVGLYVRLQIAETPAFQAAIEKNERVRVPLVNVFREHAGTLLLATLGGITTFVVFYLMTVFSLSWGTSQLGFTRDEFLILQIIGVLFFAGFIPVSAIIADRNGAYSAMVFATLCIIAFGFAFGPLFDAADTASIFMMLALGLICTGLTYGPIGTALAESFPTAVRYTGASLAFNFAGILGGSFAPYIATWLASGYGIAAVGYYLSAAGLLTLVALWLVQRREGVATQQAASLDLG